MPLTNPQIELIEDGKSGSAEVLAVIRTLVDGRDLDTITTAIKHHSDAREINGAGQASYVSDGVLGILKNRYFPTETAWVRATLRVEGADPTWAKRIAESARFGGLADVVAKYEEAVRRQQERA